MSTATSSNGSPPRCPRPASRTRPMRVWAVGAVAIGLAVLGALGLGMARAEGAGTAMGIARLGDPSGAPVVTDVLGERAAQAQFHLERLGAAYRAEIVAKARRREPARPTDPDLWDRLAWCESGGDWTTVIDGFSGGLGFADGTWISFGGEEFAPLAARATREQQIVVAQRVLARSGWGAWPGCADLLGLR